MEATYFIPEGYHAEIIDNKVVINRGVKTVSEDLLDEIHNRWEDDPHTKWPKCPYKDFKNIACHFANWQKQQMMKDSVEGLVVCDKLTHGYKDIAMHIPDYLNVGDKVKVYIIKKDFI